MQIARSLVELTQNTKPSIVTVGNFDGVHCGHKTVIAAVKSRAATRNARAVAVTFDPHPAHVLHDGPHLPLLTPLPVKLDLLEKTGLDAVLVLPFTDELRHWTARHFAERVLRDALHAIEVHEGENFRFGHQAATDIEGLTGLGRDLGFTVQVYEPIVARGAAISSSRIRALIAAGDVHKARPLLGRSFSIHSTPASGRGYGSRYAVPTINLAPYPELLPKHGVYITSLTIGTGANAKLFEGVTNIGNRPTFGAGSFAVETHLFNFEPVDLTDTTPLEMTFLHRLRDEHRFESPEALRAQIGVDVRRAQRYLALKKVLSQN